MALLVWGGGVDQALTITSFIYYYYTICMYMMMMRIKEEMNIQIFFFFFYNKVGGENDYKQTQLLIKKYESNTNSLSLA